MTLDLTHLETLLAAATPGPWDCDNKGCAWDADNNTLSEPEGGFDPNDLALVVALHNAAPALIARVRELEKRQWQPIETAPKDGTEVEVLFDSADVEIVRLCRWNDGEDETLDECWRGPKNTGWWSYKHSVTQELLSGRSMMATHWKPFVKP